jgi:acyl-CoA thioesterase FadM
MITFTLRAAHQILRGSLSLPVITPDKTVVIPFRCWPIDIDAFLHMNNSNYLLNAELARWRTLPAGKLLSRALSKEGMLFLAAENHVRYIHPISPMQKYVISTTCTVDGEDKWFYYRHTFQEHPDDIEGTAKEFAVIDLKAVVKQRNGKTVKPSTLMQESEFYREWVKKVD